jgi:N-acetyl-anhydromuramyl-L-alanine amidase AmpD
MLMSQDQAKHFFQALRQVSLEILESLGIPGDPGTKVRPWRDGRPQGVMFHYTAGVGWTESIRHLNGPNPPNKAASAQFFVLDRQLSAYVPFYAKYSELQILPTMVLMLAPLDKSTYHGNWANDRCVGIENRNAGLLRERKGLVYWWPNQYTTLFPADLGKTAVRLDGKLWEPYTRDQLISNIILGQALGCLYQGLDPSWIIPHSAVNRDKLDAGRAFPMLFIRQAIMEQAPIAELPWLSHYEQLQFMDNYDEMTEHFVGEQQDDEPFEPEKCVASNHTEDVEVAQLMLIQLGHHIDFGPQEQLSTRTAVLQFQRSVGITIDGSIGPETLAALRARLADFGLRRG